MAKPRIASKDLKANLDKPAPWRAPTFYFTMNVAVASSAIAPDVPVNLIV